MAIPSKIYRARHPVFQTMMDDSAADFDQQDAAWACAFSVLSKALPRR